MVFILNIGAGKAWNEVEILFAAQAFVWASEDHVRGNVRKFHQFQKSIEEQYAKLMQNRQLEEPTWSHSTPRCARYTSVTNARKRNTSHWRDIS
jgi:hypothetical protein